MIFCTHCQRETTHTMILTERMAACDRCGTRKPAKTIIHWQTSTRPPIPPAPFAKNF